MADNDLSSLIRVRKHAVEQKQKVLADLYKLADELKNERERLLAQLEQEREKADELGPDMVAYFGPYAEAVNEKIEGIEKKESALEARIQIAQDDMRNAYTELKKIEITQRQREEEEAKEQAKKEDNDLDEIALEIFRRQREEDDWE